MRKVLLGLLMVFFVVGLSACGTNEIETATEKNNVYADALAIEQAAKLYCADLGCSIAFELTWTDLKPYVYDLDESKYDFTADSGVIAVNDAGEVDVFMERAGTGDWEFPQGEIPSEMSADDCVEDDN